MFDCLIFSTIFRLVKPWLLGAAGKGLVHPVAPAMQSGRALDGTYRALVDGVVVAISSECQLVNSAPICAPMLNTLACYI